MPPLQSAADVNWCAMELFLNCPHCNWDLPLRPHGQIHLCSSCKKAWEEKNGRFADVSYKIGSTRPSDAKDVLCLPFVEEDAYLIEPTTKLSIEKAGLG